MSEKCKKSVWRSNRWNPTRCSRNAVRDGFCKQHHPDSERAREEASLRRWKEEVELKRHRVIRVGLRDATTEQLREELARRESEEAK